MTKELFKHALQFVLKWEGGYSNHPNDKGGATNKGITQYTYNKWLSSRGLNHKDVRHITDSEAEEIYYNDYWLPAGCEKMSDKFAILAFDTAVNMGVNRVEGFLKAANYTSIDKFILARAEKYNEIASNSSQRCFLHGWLNRLFDLKKFVNS